RPGTRETDAAGPGDGDARVPPRARPPAATSPQPPVNVQEADRQPPAALAPTDIPLPPPSPPPHAPPALPAPPPARRPPAAPATAGPDVERRGAGPGADADAAGPARTGPAPTTTSADGVRPFEPIVLSAASATTAVRPGPRRSARHALVDLGVPERLLEGDEAVPGQAATLSELVARFDPAPGLASAPGSVIAVVGEGGAALATARQMAGRLRQSPQDDALAGVVDPVAGHGRRMTTPGALERFRERARAANRPYVVVVGSGPRESPSTADLV